jgi:hypothetical protein
LEEIRIPLRPFLGPLIRGFFYWFVCIARNLSWCGLPARTSKTRLTFTSVHFSHAWFRSTLAVCSLNDNIPIALPWAVTLGPVVAGCVPYGEQATVGEHLRKHRATEFTESSANGAG